jgi:hypothetical protein
MNKLLGHNFAYVVLLLLVLLSFGPSALGQSSTQGQWQTLSYTMPINPVHVALLYNGKVVIVSGSGNLPSDTNYAAALWDPQAGTITTQPVAWDMFCNGMVIFPDGRPFVMGGTLQYDPFHGELSTSTYDPSTNTFTNQQSMAHGRWYPTGTVLGDGRIMIFSGLDETGSTNTSVEFYTVGSGWSSPFSAPWTPPLYPRMHLLPNGKVFYSGSTTGSSLFNPATTTWTTNVAFTNYSGTRTYGSSVLLPLTPANSYTPKVMIFGGGNPSTNTTEIIDLSAATPKWVYGPNMSQPRIEMDATILPNGKVLALGGSLNDEDTATASLNADLYDPSTNTFSSAGAEVYARLYHSVSLLMPDATVWVAGGNPARGTYEPHMEIYSPPYLFNSNGSLATRPVITNVSSGIVGYGSAFQVQTANAANIASVVLMRNGAVTHAFDMDQRYVGLSFTIGSGVLNVTGPPNGNIAPPGYYMLFILNSSGVPSVASMVQVSAGGGDVPPTGTITSPASNVTISAGQSVSYSGSGTDPDGTISGYSWSFPGGTPTSSLLANPGSVTYSTPGTYVTTFTVTDNAGLTDPHPPTRTITVQPDFSLSASPVANTVSPGGNIPYTVTVTPGTGFAGSVSFGVTGLPTGASATFNPTAVSASGSSTMTVSTLASTPVGSYTLVITGTSGAFAYTTNVTLNVGSGPPPPITFVQVGASTPQSPQTSVTVPFTVAQAAGDLNVVVVGWNDSTAAVKTLTDTRGNAYVLGVGPTIQSGVATQSIYYAKNISSALANGNSVTVTFTTAANYPDIRIAEYSGLDTVNPFDVGVGAVGNSSTGSSGPVTTTNANDLLIGANVVQTGTPGAGTGFTSRIITNPDSDILEDRVVSAISSYSASAPVSPSAQWVMQIAAFKAAGSAPTPTAPTNLAAVAASPVQVNLTWAAATESGGTINQYMIERCAGVNCGNTPSNFSQIGTTPATTTSYSDIGLLGSTSYTYRARATDTANTTGPYSTLATATTAAPTFTVPSNLTATPSGPVQINLSWTAATETGGSISQYLVERCAGANCGNTPSNFSQVGSTPPTTTTLSDTGLLGSASYSYRVRATDAASNLSAYSAIATATTAAPTLTAPASLTATAISNSQINLSWAASTESGGTISQYLIESCAGVNCANTPSNFSQIASSTTTGYNSTGLTASTSYSYRVRATDAAGDLSPYSTTATASTPAATPTAPSNLTAAAAGPVQMNLSWTASTESGGTISQYLVERCAGVNCGSTPSNFSQVGATTAPTTTFSDTTGLLGSTSYSYRVRAKDAAGTTGPYSNIATATTTAPTLTAPTNLALAVAGPAQVNLTWTASAETGGTLSQYLIERCAGVNCGNTPANFSQVGTSPAATTSYNDAGLLGLTSYSYRVRATDGASNFSAYSTVATATTAAPTFTAPSGLTATAVGSTQINLSWTVGSETGGTISNYLVERCQGSGCLSFTQVAAVPTTTFSDISLLAGTTYGYRVRATDAANNTSGYSNTASATTTTTPPPPITFIQVNSATPQSPQTTVTVPFTAPQTAGNLNVVVVGWNDSTAAVKTLADTKGNVYTLAVGPTVQTGVATQSIYYAKNIAAAAANGNSVTVTFTTAAIYPDIRAAEYSGLDTVSPFDVSVGTSGSGTTSSSGPVTTVNANDLLIAANLVQTGTNGAGSGFTSRVITAQDADILEDQIVTIAGSYTATAPISPSAQWIMQIVAFKRHP